MAQVEGSAGTCAILVVDDDPSLRAVLQDGLEVSIQGCVADGAADGEEAMEHVRRQIPDLIILDVRMPVKDGLDTLEEIRALSGVPVIMLSVSDTHRKRAMALGANDYLTKPISAQDLLRAVTRLL